MLLAISPTCFKKVRSFQIETILNKQCISSFINHNVNSNGLLQLSALSEANIHKHTSRLRNIDLAPEFN